MSMILSITFAALAIAAILSMVALYIQQSRWQNNIQELFTKQKTEQQQYQQQQLQQQQQQQLQGLSILQESLQKALILHGNQLTAQVDKLITQVQQQLKDMNQVVERRLNEGFEKTTATFVDIVKRLALIDEAQKKITELSTHVVSLQGLLSDKRSRGAMGEVQLNTLLSNVLPEQHYRLQHTLSNQKRVDCLLILPEPTGNLAIDAKFPLENYQRLSNPELLESERTTAKKQFALDIRQHIETIASKYILPGETADGAMMFIPAEAIFAEIHAHYPEIVALAHRQRVWMVSPSTLMAVLTTANAVLKDAATREQVHIIQEHLGFLAKDFDRFKERMNKLAIHIDQASRDVGDIKISADKISSRFNKIEQVELESLEEKTPLLEEPS